MELVDVQPCADAFGAVLDDAVPYLLEDDEHAEGPQGLAELGDVVDDEPVGGVDVRLLREAGEGPY